MRQGPEPPEKEAEADTVARLEGLLAQALEANKQLAALAERQREEIVGLA